MSLKPRAGLPLRVQLQGKQRPSLQLCDAGQKIYWVSNGPYPALEVAFVNGSDRRDLFREQSAQYTGITLLSNSLYISDSTRRYRPIAYLKDSLTSWGSFFVFIKHVKGNFIIC